MTTILARLAALNFLLLLAAFGVGLGSFFTGGLLDPESSLFPLHFYLGLTSVLLNLGVHSLVFIYFLGTGRWIKEVAQAYRIPDDPLPKITRALKRSTFPVALTAMLVPIATAAAGAKAQGREWHWSAHLSLAAASILVNVWAFYNEYRNVPLECRDHR